jgi:hypothetical protein
MNISTLHICEVKWTPLWHRLTSCLTNFLSWILVNFWSLFFLKDSLNNLVQCTEWLEIFQSVERPYVFKIFVLRVGILIQTKVFSFVIFFLWIHVSTLLRPRNYFDVRERQVPLACCECFLRFGSSLFTIWLILVLLFYSSFSHFNIIIMYK